MRWKLVTDQSVLTLAPPRLPEEKSRRNAQRASNGFNSLHISPCYIVPSGFELLPIQRNTRQMICAVHTRLEFAKVHSLSSLPYTFASSEGWVKCSDRAGGARAYNRARRESCAALRASLAP